MAQSIILKRSSLPGKVPDTGSLNAGELAINTYDGKIFIKRAGNVDSIQSVLTTNSTTTGSITLTQTGSFAELVTTQDGNIGRDLYVIRDIITNNDIDAGGDISGSGLQVNDTLNITHEYLTFTGSANLTGSVGVLGDLTVIGSVNARQFNINVISSSVIYQSGSTKFGDTIDDTHQFTGSIDVSGSILINGVELGASANSGSFTGSFTGSFFGDGSGLRGVVSDDLPIDGWDYQSNSSASISDFNITSSKYLIDFEWDSEMGTPVGHKTFISNKSGSTQVVPTDYGVKFVVGNNVVATIDSNGIQASAPAGTVSGSSQLTGSYDTRYVLSGSITQTNWDNIAFKPGGIVSGSEQVVGILLSLNTYTSSNNTTNDIQNGRLNNLESTSASVNTSITSINGHIFDINSKTGSFETNFSTLQTYTSSVNAQISRLQESTASLNTFTASNDNISLNSYTSSLKTAIELTGSTVSFLGNIVVYGTQSVINSQNVEISDNILYLSPTASIDNDLGIVGHYNDGTYRHAGIFMDASDGHSWKVFNGLTTETSAQIDTAGTGFTLADFKAGAFTGTSFTGIHNGTINSTNGVVSGSSQVSFTGIVDKPTLVSGSSQVDVMSTTNITRLATTGSNTFNGTQTISGSLNITSSLSVGNITSAPNGENTLNVFAPLNGGNGEGGQILLAASGGLYTSASMIDNYQNSFRILKGTNTGGSTAAYFTLNLDNGNTTFAGTITENSSLRYKENVETIKYGLDKVLQMRGVTYDKKDNGVKEMGVIAEEVYDVLPEVVLKNEEGEVDSVSYGRIVGVLIEAIKDLKKEIEDLKLNR